MQITDGHAGFIAFNGLTHCIISYKIYTLDNFHHKIYEYIKYLALDTDISFWSSLLRVKMIVKSIIPTITIFLRQTIYEYMSIIVYILYMYLLTIEFLLGYSTF